MQPDIVEGFKLSLDIGDMFEKFQRLVDRHVQHIGDALSLVVNLQGLAVVSLSFANLAYDIDIRQEMHFDLDRYYLPGTLHSACP
jgi:hypothetical protein